MEPAPVEISKWSPRPQDPNEQYEGSTGHLGDGDAGWRPSLAPHCTPLRQISPCCTLQRLSLFSVSHPCRIPAYIGVNIAAVCVCACVRASVCVCARVCHCRLQELALRGLHPAIRAVQAGRPYTHARVAHTLTHTCTHLHAPPPPHTHTHTYYCALLASPGFP